jgi:hypothetical protein
METIFLKGALVAYLIGTTITATTKKDTIYSEIAYLLFALLYIVDCAIDLSEATTKVASVANFTGICLMLFVAGKQLSLMQLKLK